MHMNDFLNRTTICGLRKLADPAGHTHVLSLIDPEWDQPDAFASFPPSQWLLQRFHDDIENREGRLLPTRESVAEILAFGKKLNTYPNPRLFIHCLSGKSRSTAAAVMIWAQAMPERSEASIIEHLLQARPEAWPNSLMLQHADDLLGRNGRLIQATRELYKRGLAANPGWARSLERMGRSSEIVV
jgi:predicted protein tyrosine phosphatase